MNVVRAYIYWYLDKELKYTIMSKLLALFSRSFLALKLNIGMNIDRHIQFFHSCSLALRYKLGLGLRNEKALSYPALPPSLLPGPHSVSFFGSRNKKAGLKYIY